MPDRFDIQKTTSTASEDFKKNLLTGKRYVDKTKILIPLLNGDHESTFFLRPRRFGKTLMLSMIRYFIEDTKDDALNEENRALFKDLEIMEAGERFTRRMTSYPVLHLTMQTVSGRDFEEAFHCLAGLIRSAYDEKSYLLKSGKLSDTDKKYYQAILQDGEETGRGLARIDYTRALKNLTEYLRKDSGKPCVVLIDEYDVPLEKAYRNGYYRQMVELIGPLFQNVLKSNTANLEFAVITGCLRIAKEGIYTGLNNPEVNTVLTPGRNDYYGFTEKEVRDLLVSSGLENHFMEVRDWYDGYQFGYDRIYNPWSVIKYIEALVRDPQASPMPYWAGTSANAIIRELAERADAATREKLDQAMQGKSITFNLSDNIVYDDILQNQDNVFNVMLATGYLTALRYDADTVEAVIPNREVHKIFRDQIRAWFNATLPSFDVKEFYAAMEQSRPERVQRILTDRFLSAMSFYDTVEAFYHGVTLTLLQLNQDYVCVSNRESGSGRYDVMCKQLRDWALAFVLEFKVSDDPRQMLDDAEAAAKQIREKHYVADLQREGYQKILTYGISFCEKRCRVVQGETIE